MTLHDWTPAEQDRHAADLEDAADPVKWCPTCEHTKALTDFPIDRRRGDGRRWQCRPCGNAADRARAAKRRQAKMGPQPCANCKARRHGRWCTASLWGPPCPCRCRAGLGLTEFLDATAPEIADQLEEVA